MTRALDLIESRLEEQLDVADIAEAAYASPFHFQRMFFMLTGVTLSEYVRNRRLTQAAHELCMSSERVIDIALKYGYETPESFSKAFRKLHGISPSEARNPGVQLKSFPRMVFHLSLRGDKPMEYRMVQKDAFYVVGKSIRTSIHGGENQKEIPRFWQNSFADGTADRLCAVAKDENMYGLCYGMQKDGHFDYAIAVEGDTDGAGGEFERILVPAATWAVFTSVGPMPGAIQETWNRVFQEWLPASGYEQAEAPDFELYPPGDSCSADYRCEVWIPVVKK